MDAVQLSAAQLCFRQLAKGNDPGTMSLPWDDHFAVKSWVEHVLTLLFRRLQILTRGQSLSLQTLPFTFVISFVQLLGRSGVKQGMKRYELNQCP